MRISDYFSRIYVASEETGTVIRFAGNASPVTPNGGLLTCRHVVDVSLESTQALYVTDEEAQHAVRLLEYSSPIIIS